MTTNCHVDPLSLPFTPLPPSPSPSSLVKVSLLLNGRFSSNPRIFVLESKTLKNPPILNNNLQLFPVFCFLVEKKFENGKLERTLFDLGIRKDTHNFSPTTQTHVLPFFRPHPTQSPDVVESLAQGGLTVADIDRVILSHNHFDHIGNPFLFPSSTEFFIGEFNSKENEAKYSVEGEQTIAWRKLLADGNIKWEPVGSFERGWDFYGDGSFWIIDAPGHCTGHMIALARTTTDPDSYMLFAGDAAHAQCLYKSKCPTSLGGENPPHHHDTRHPCGLFSKALQFDAPEQDLVLSIHDDLEQAYKTIAKISRMDALDNVFVVAAHEIELDGVVPLFPESANDWLIKGWKNTSTKTAVKDSDLKEDRSADVAVVGLGLLNMEME